MALSERDQNVLREIETALRADTRTSPDAHQSAERGSRHYLTAAIAMVVAGVIVLAVGVGLQDDLGTALGVVGFLLIMGSAWSGTHLLDAAREFTATRIGTSANKLG